MSEGDYRFYIGMSKPVLDQRSRHNVLAVETIRMGTRTIAARVVVAQDRRLILLLEKKGLWRAYSEIVEAFNIWARAVGPKTSDPSRARGVTPNAKELELAKVLKITEWKIRCQAMHISSLMAMDIIIDGRGLRETARHRHVRFTTPLENLIKCLEVW